ncbi:MAG: DUF3164 family protein [Cyclobacteriaceae bacterium]
MTEVTEQPIEFSEDQLKEMLKKKKAERTKEMERQRKAYESKRDKAADTLMAKAKELHKALAQFKDTCHVTMDNQKAALENYSGMPSKSKGGFSIAHSSDEFRIRRMRDTEPTWDERAEKGIELIKDFMSDFLKKKDKEAFEIIQELISRNKKGDLEYSKVFSLMKFRNSFADERWHKGLQLLEESFGNHLKGYGYIFQLKNTESGKWETISLNFSAL